MKNVGIICEYNPFHGGHAHLLHGVKGEGATVALMSGCFTERGEAALLPPAPRALMAMEEGADAVLMLPYPYSAAGARYFATAGVRALAALGVDTLAFGSESADLTALTAAAKASLAAEEKGLFRGENPKTGDAAAYFETLGISPLSNDILAIEYLRAICGEHLSLTPFPVKREGDGYREKTVGEGFPSATALREKVAQGEDITPLLLPSSRKIFTDARERFGFAQTEKLGDMLLALLRKEKAISPQTGRETDIAECGGGVLFRLMEAAETATDYPSLLEEAATKRYTAARLRRALLFFLTGVTKEDLTAPPSFLRLLAVNEKGRAFLAETRKTRTVPVLTKDSELSLLPPAARRAVALEEVARGLFALLLEKPTAPAAVFPRAPLTLAKKD